MPATPPRGILKAANRIHVALYRMSGGKFANTIANLPILLMTTVGRKSGKRHTNPVVFITEGSDYLVSASAGSMALQPGWYFNLRDRPEATIQIGTRSFRVRAAIAEGEERTQLYAKFKAASPNFVKFEKTTSRIIPVIRLIAT